ncbi:MAG: hypothetical protein C4536_14935 [Actinobacteria bacterium]|jgi:hypothetical protein|nr:MAG: hypothetical protein C4536_14935 [Actinomycetota bacterium]
MGAEIIAEKFALLKTRGSNGVAYTHIVEDILLGQRAVVKVSDKLEDLGLDYLKTINLAREADIAGLLMPLEGGLLEEEAAYYLAFPELGEPSLDNYLRMGAPLTCREILDICEHVLTILEGLHEAGFLHLFIDARNVFYRPGRGITLKDPALRQEFFHPLLELISSPDFFYLSPAVMDGILPGEADDLYAVGKLAQRLAEKAADARTSTHGPAVLWLAERCCGAGTGADCTRVAAVRRELVEEREAAGGCPGMQAASLAGLRAGKEGDGPTLPAAAGSLSARGGGKGRKRGVWTALALALLLVLAGGVTLALFIAGEVEKAPALGRGGRSVAGDDAALEGALQARDRPPHTGVSAADLSPQGEVMEASHVDVTGDRDGAEADRSAVDGGEESATGTAPPAAPPADPSPAAPVASFSVSPGEGQSPLRVYLDASASYDPDGCIVSYAWSCGGSGMSRYHVCESNVIPATIPITLTVSDDGGHTSSTTRYVTLY